MIETHGLIKKFGRITAVKDVSMKVEKGEIYGLVGPDGAGKTTLIRMLCGIITPTSGTVTLRGGSPGGREKTGCTLGYMPQRFSLYGDLTVMENINFYGRLYGLGRPDIKERAGEMLELTKLAPFTSRFADNLSGGMKQKLALTCALLSRPQIIILDEPTFGVDPESRKEFWKIIYQLNKRGITILVSTSYMDEAELCRRVAFMNGGRLVAVDSPVGLKKNFPYKILELKAGAKELHLPTDLPHVLDADFFGDKYHIMVTDAGAGIESLGEYLRGRGVEIFSLREVPATIEDIFVAMAEGEAL